MLSWLLSRDPSEHRRTWAKRGFNIYAVRAFVSCANVLLRYSRDTNASNIRPRDLLALSRWS